NPKPFQQPREGARRVDVLKICCQDYDKAALPAHLGMTVNSRPYSESFFEGHVNGSLRSAREIIPVLFSFVKPASVIDVGCGLGAWLAAFVEFGVADVMGIDVDYINRSQLLIPQPAFVPTDLAKPFSLPR